jgi:hypothetical protein
MHTVARQWRVVCLLTVACTLGHLTTALAEPSPACRALAKQFADTPEKLSADNLFRLQACIHRELGQRGVDDPSTLPPSMPKLPFVPGLPAAPGAQ